MSYNLTTQVQSWLNITKYSILEDNVDQGQVQTAADYVLSALEHRYDTSTWTDDTNTPGMVLRIIAMQTASFMLRKAISEDDGTAKYCDWLDARVLSLLTGLVDGSLDLPDVDPDPTSPGVGSIGFFPTAAATLLWQEEGNVEGAAARYFDMQTKF